MGELAHQEFELFVVLRGLVPSWSYLFTRLEQLGVEVGFWFLGHREARKKWLELEGGGLGRMVGSGWKQVRGGLGCLLAVEGEKRLKGWLVQRVLTLVHFGVIPLY